MRPKLVEIPLGIFTIPINSYGFMLMIGFLVGVIICSRRGKRLGISPDFVIDMTIWIMIASIVGSRLGYIVQFREQFDLRVFDLTDGGISLFGGIVGWLLPLFFYMHRRRATATGAAGGAPLLTAKELGVMVPLCLVSALLGARGVHLATNYDRYDWGILHVWEGGMAFYGGVILASVAGLYFARRSKIPMLRIADLVMPEVALGYGITRIGCFLNGCCYGVVAKDLPIAVTFPRLMADGHLIGSPAYLDHLTHGWVTETAECSLPVHPTQLYSVAWGLVLFGILSWMWYRRKREGEVFAWFGLLYSVERFLMEFWRADNQPFAPVEGWQGWLTIWQWASVATFVGSIFFLLWVYKKQPQLTEAERNPIGAAAGSRAEAVAKG